MTVAERDGRPTGKPAALSLRASAGPAARHATVQAALSVSGRRAIVNAGGSSTSLRVLPVLALGMAIALGAVAGTRPLLGLAAGAAALVGVILLTRPAWATLAVILLVYSNVVVIAVQFHGLPGVVSVAVPLLLLVPFVHLVLLRRQPIVFTPALPWLVAFLVVQVVGTLLAADRQVAIDEVRVFLLEGFALYFGLTNVVRTEGLLRRIVWALLVLAAALAAVSLHQTLTGAHENNYLGFAQISERHLEQREVLLEDVDQATPFRVGGPLGQTNRYAQILVVLVPFGLLLTRRGGSTLGRLVAVGATTLIIVGVALTFSRGTAVGLALTLLVMVLMGQLRPVQLVGMVLGVVLLSMAFPYYVERLSSLGAASTLVTKGSAVGDPDGAVVGRLSENLAALRMVADNPVFGVGPGMSPYHQGEETAEIGLRVRDEREAHSLYLGVAAETGLVGLLCFLVIIGVTLRDLVRARRRWLRTRPALANLMTGFLLALVAYLATGLFLHLSFARYFWLLMALGTAASSIVPREADDRLDPAPSLSS